MKTGVVLALCVGVPAIAGIGFGAFAAKAPKQTELDSYLGESTKDPGPQVGQTVTLPATDGFGRKLPKAGQILLIVAGNCYICSSRKWKPEKVIPLSKRPVVVLYWLNPDQVTGGLPYLKSHASLVFDPKQQVLPVEFSYFAPYPCVIDLDTHKVVTVPWSDETVTTFVERS